MAVGSAVREGATRVVASLEVFSSVMVPEAVDIEASYSLRCVSNCFYIEVGGAEGDGKGIGVTV